MMEKSVLVACFLLWASFFQSIENHKHDNRKKEKISIDSGLDLNQNDLDKLNSKLFKKSDSEIVAVDEIDIEVETVPKDDPDKLKFGLFPELDVYVPTNSTAGVAVFLDYRNNISSMFNGKTGAAIIFSYIDEYGFYIPPKLTDKTWNNKRESYVDYFSKVSSKELYEVGQSRGIHFNPTSITGEISDKVQEILAPLSVDYSSKCDPAGVFFYVSKITADDLRSSLSGFRDVMTDTQTPIRGNFKWLIGIFQGMGDFFAPFDGGIKSLTDKGVKLSLEKILSSPTSFHVFIYFLQELNPHFDLGNILKDVVNQEDQFFTVTSKLAGDITYGFDGFILVVSVVINVVKGEESAQNLVIILHEYYSDPRTDNHSVREKWKPSIDILDKTIQKLNLTESFDGLAKMTQAILDNNWIVNNVNMSAVTEALLEGDNHPRTIKAILNLLKKK